MASETSQPLALLGLMECPFRKGYIEFEYEAGDTTSELRARIAQVWGSPVESHDRWYRRHGLLETGLWAILCEDESGAYFTLRDDDEIPTSPPKACTTVEGLTISLEIEREMGLPSGLIHDMDIRRLSRRDENERHLRLELHREYEVPKDKTYSVKLVALVVIRGG